MIEPILMYTEAQLQLSPNYRLHVSLCQASTNPNLSIQKNNWTLMNTGALFQLIPIYEIKKIPRFFMYIRAHRLLIPINQIKRTGL